MKIISRTLNLLLAVTCITITAKAFHPSSRPELPNVDRRAEKPVPAAAAGANGLRVAQANGLANLKRQLPEARVDLDLITGAARHVSARDGFLTGPGARGRGLPASAPAGLAANDRHRAARAFLREHRGVFGHGPEVLDAARIQREFVAPNSGARTVVWQQELEGVDIFEGLLIAHTTRLEELVSVSSQFLGDPAQAADAGNPNRAQLLNAPAISAGQALKLAAKDVGDDPTGGNARAIDEREGPSRRQRLAGIAVQGEATVRLVWLPMSGASLRLCWEVVFTSGGRGEMFRTLVDAQNGEVHVRRCLTDYISNASYRVYVSDSPSPFSPGHPTLLTSQPPLAARVLVVTNAVNTNASPNGWINDGDNETRGNNVDAHLDRNNDNSPDLPRPQGSPSRVFDFPLDLTQDPTLYGSAATVQLFYWCNWMHDKLYELGFTEAAGNFQVNNFGRGGSGNDAVQADAQDGGGFNNANMSTPSDGGAPRMQMYLFDGPTPDRDGDYDAEVILHEYTHGLSNRRVGGGGGLSALQSRGMGEGWSDFYGLALLSEASDNVNGNFPPGGYLTYQLSGLLQNYYYGIRRYPYSTDLAKNPLTFKDIDPSQASAHAGIPASPVVGGGGATEVHNQGEVWCVALWEARVNLINKYGFAIGNRLILQLVTDGMNLSPVNPNFLQARDGILQADRVNNGGTNLNELWAGFAKRGMGFSASSPASSTTAGVHESFDVPDSLAITPQTDFTATGPVGGPFTPLTATYVLTNATTNLVIWRATVASNWLTVTPASGTLLPGAGTTVNAALTLAANALPLGLYRDTIRFSNEVSMVAQTRMANLLSGHLDYFTEEFTGAENDLDFQTFTFTPDASANYYSVCREVATNYPTDLTGATNLVLGNHAAQTLSVTGGMTISLFGQATNVFHLSSDGHLTLNGADTSGSATLANHFSRPRVAAFLSHLHPGDGGAVLYQQLSNRVAVTFKGVPEFATVNTNNFQIELFFDGRIRLTYLSMGSTPGIAGLSRGTGLPPVFLESDFSTYGPCGLPLFVTVPAGAAEGSGTLAGAGSVRIAEALPTNLVVQLTSSDLTEVTVPPTVTIPAGSTNASFDLAVQDDALLDGTQVPVIGASAPGFLQPAAAFSVFDNESATLSLSLPLMTGEGSGSITGILSVSAAPDTLIAVNVTSDDPTEIIAPAVVFIPAGQTSVPISFNVVDDTEIDGPQNVLLTARVVNWIDGTASVTVADNETLNLSLTLLNPLREGQGTVNAGATVRLTGTLSSNLVVNLASSDLTELTVPATVTILAGQFSATFSPTVIDDAQVDGAQSVQVDATTAGFIAASVSTIVQDDETPLPPLNPSPADLSSNVVTTADLAWQAGDTNVPTDFDVYFGTNPLPGPAELLGTTTSTAWPLPTLAPATTCFWQIVARRQGTTPGPVWQFSTRGVHHFDWSAIAPTQYLSEPFAVTVTARDEAGVAVTNFTGPASLAAFGGTATTPFFAEDFEDGDFAGWTTGTDTVTRQVTSATAAEGLRSFTISGGQNTHLGGIYRAFSNITPAVVNFSVRASATNLAGGYFVIGSGPVTAPTNAVFFYMDTTGQMGLILDNVADVLVPYQPNRWYSVQLALDWNGRKVDLSIDGALIQAAIPFRNTNAASMSVAHLYNYSSTQNWWDDIRFATGPGLGGIAMTPTSSGAFVNGSWSGSLTMLAPDPTVLLRASEAGGASGDSSAFAMIARDDLSVTVADAPDPVGLGQLLTYSVNVANSGPSAATSVLLTNELPAGMTFVSVNNSQGVCTPSGGNVVCTLGVIPAGASANVVIQARPTVVGPILFRATVVRGEADAFVGNNSATTLTTVSPPTLSISDASASEGNTGLSNLLFLVSLSVRASNTVTVSYSTTGGSAAAGADFLSTNGVLTFLAGETNKLITVRSIGDTENESNETFTVSLSSPVNAVIADGLAQGTILNDDFLARVGLAGITIVEENCGTPNGSLDPLETVKVQVALQNASAGGAIATNLNATLISISGVFRPSGPQNYGLVPPGAVVSRPFTFTAVNVCGGAVSAIFQLDDGGVLLGRVTNIYRLGTNIFFRENFDSVISGTLPAGWTRSSSGNPPPWDTQNTTRHSLPNAAFAADPDFTSDNQLTSPAFMVPPAPARLSFFHSYATEAAFDGGNLEISINGGAFTDIITSGGTFVRGGYSGTIAGGTVPAWIGSIAGFSNVIVNLPAAASGASIALQWRFRTDGSVGSTGWFVDTITADAYLGCCTSSPPLITQITWNAGNINLRWLSLPGSIYRLQHRAAVDAGIWTDAPGDVLATSTLSQKNDTPGASPRYYRVVMLP